jgi:hypothetical protein
LVVVGLLTVANLSVCSAYSALEADPAAGAVARSEGIESPDPCVLVVGSDGAAVGVFL